MDSETSIVVMNPYTCETVGEVASASSKNMEEAIAIAAAYKAELTRHERCQILNEAARIVKDRFDILSQQIVLESGLCWKDAIKEVDRVRDIFSFAASLCLQEDAAVFAGDVGSHGASRKIFSFQEPVNAIGAITPFNHPLCQVAHKVAPAIATNNCIVVKPSEKTPLSALRVAEILYEAGLPPAMLSVVPGPAKELADVLVRHPNIDVLAFTGSTQVGRALAQKVSYKKLLLELGGNDVLIVLPDVDLEQAVALAVRGAFGNSGQRCTAIKRILVHEEIAGLFAQKLAENAGKLVCGNPFDRKTDVGTVINESAAILIERRVTAAIEAGANLLTGHHREGALYWPTVLDNVSSNCELIQRETFGPVAPLIRFKTIDEAISLANQTEFGLSAGVCTTHWPSALRFIKGLKVGSVNIGEVPSYRTEISPFGGIKGSGLGFKEGLIETMRFYTNTKTVSIPWCL